jgi:chromosome partitioning protein
LEHLIVSAKHESPHTLIFSVSNQKGGVGKTTTTINLGTGLAAIGKKVLLIDLDPQGNASTGLGIPGADRALTTFDLLIDGAQIEQVATSTSVPNMDIATANADLSSVDMELVNDKSRVTRLRSVINRQAEAFSKYDFVFIDCPPSLNLLTLNAMVASDFVLVPLQAEFFALEGLSQLMMSIKEVRQTLNPRLRMHGIVLTMFDGRNNLAKQVEADVRTNLGNLVYKTKIPRNVRLSEAPSHAIPALVYDHRSVGSVAYQKLAAELLARVTNQNTREDAEHVD